MELCDREFYPETEITTVLGTKWNLGKDTLNVRDVEVKNIQPTKRNILKMTASFFDVFGILSGILVKPKILLQKLWQYGLDWDDRINPESDLYGMFKKIKRDLNEVSSVEIHRYLIPKKFHGRAELPRISLHGFSDASEDAMGIGIWMRWSDKCNQDAELSFVCARFTPLKQSSIPRKELQAMLLLSRLMIVVRDALRLHVDYMMMWTDSYTTISWLKGQSKFFRSYVAYRVGEITTEFNPNQNVLYVPTDQNTIDFVSRGINASEIQTIIDGPIFLREPEGTWSKTPKDIPLDKDDIELKKFHVRNAKVLALAVQRAELVPVIDSNKYSSWTKLIMVTARTLSLKDIPKNKRLKDLTETITQWPSFKRIKEAKLYWVREAQRNINFEDHNVMKLEPIFDETENVHRIGGRLDKAKLSYDIWHPYLLPKKHNISLLIARDRHIHCLHGGHLRTAAEIRKQVWIIGDTNLSRQVVRECKVCVRHRGKPIEQRMADFPYFRIKPYSPLLQTTMVDYLGPINVKLNRNTVTKGYCAVTRAVHLTCVQDLSTSAFLQALERFVSYVAHLNC